VFQLQFWFLDISRIQNWGWRFAKQKIYEAVVAQLVECYRSLFGIVGTLKSGNRLSPTDVPKISTHGM